MLSLVLEKHAVRSGDASWRDAVAVHPNNVVAVRVGHALACGAHDIRATKRYLRKVGHSIVHVHLTRLVHTRLIHLSTVD